MRAFSALILLLFVWTTGDPLLGDTARRQPLDLPSGGGLVDESEEEDAPELITFYGHVFEGDGFFWSLDKSGSMGGNRLMVLKDEVTRAIQSLSPAAEFGFVAFSSNVVAWRNQPVQATSAEKAVATCPARTPFSEIEEAVRLSVRRAVKRANRRRPEVFVVLHTGYPGDAG